MSSVPCSMSPSDFALFAMAYKNSTSYVFLVDGVGLIRPPNQLFRCFCLFRRRVVSVDDLIEQWIAKSNSYTSALRLYSRWGIAFA